MVGPGLNLYDISVENGSVATSLAASYTKLGGSSSLPDANGPSFLDYPENSGLPRPCGIMGQAAGAVADTIGAFPPLGNSSLAPDLQLPTQFIFGESSSYLSLVQGLYRHSDNLQNWTTNIAQALTSNFAIVAPASATDEYNGIAMQSQIHFKIRWCGLMSPMAESC